MIKCRQIYIAHLIYGNHNVLLDILDVLETDLFEVFNLSTNLLFRLFASGILWLCDFLQSVSFPILASCKRFTKLYSMQRCASIGASEEIYQWLEWPATFNINCLSTNPRKNRNYASWVWNDPHIKIELVAVHKCDHRNQTIKLPQYASYTYAL